MGAGAETLENNCGGGSAKASKVAVEPLLLLLFEEEEEEEEEGVGVAVMKSNPLELEPGRLWVGDTGPWFENGSKLSELEKD
jgi:hypothetical protein